MSTPEKLRSSPADAWHAEHAYFGKLLRLLQREVDVFHTGERPNYELMLDVISYLREFGDRFHHPREDVAFARLKLRCPELELPLARLRQEHAVIARAGETLGELLRAIVDGTLVSRAEVEMAAAMYLVYYGNHIAKEEEDRVGRAAEQLSAADWEAVRAAIPSQGDPLFGAAPEERYRALRHLIATAG
jgi:hemerythrin-like domain-containing protein